jgi:all-trans-8'-apo-beta-carotenal 15,15'-oxygenase
MPSTSSRTGVSRRTLLAAGLALGAAPLAHAAKPADAWRSTFAPYGGPLKAPLQTDNLALRGRWPSELRGTFYRTGPARRELGGVMHTHWFDGDGMVQAFRFDGRHVSHRGVMLATPKLKAEEAAGRLLYPGFGGAVPIPAPVAGPDTLNPANINLLPLDGGRKLYGLWEAGSALELDPQTLAARGFKAWSPETAGAPFSAHPRVAIDGTVWNFGYLPGSGRLLIYEIDRHGTLRRQTVVPAPQADMVHDFAVTERYLVFLLMPLRFEREAGSSASFLDRYRWDAAAPLIAMLVDKADFSTRRFELPSQGLFHIGNAWEHAGGVELAFAAHPALLDVLRSLHIGQPRPSGLAATHWTRVRLEPATGRAVAEPSGVENIEFPRFDPRRGGVPSRFALLMQRSAAMHGGVDGFDSVLTLHGEQRRRFGYGDGWIAEEHVFVPRAASAPEGDGWVLGTAYHWPSERTSLSVFDAAAVDAGPVAQVQLPYGLPLGFHGQFVAAA